MQVNELKRQIHDKQVGNFYVFTGEEVEAQRIYLNKIAEITHKPIIRIEQVSESFNKRNSLLKTYSLFVCRDDMNFWKTATSVDEIKELLGNNMLVIQMTDIDKRSKASKEYEDLTVTFNYMDADVLYKYVQKKCRLSDDNSYDLIERCEQDYSRILLEIDKVIQYARASGIDVNEAYTALIGDGAISKPPKDAIFEFTDALLRAKIQEAFGLLEQCKALGEPPLRIISVLYTNFRRVLQVQACTTNDVCKTTGLSAWDVKLAQQTLGYWKISDLVFFLRTLQRLEQKIKNGEVEEGTALDLLMVLIL